MALDAIPCYPRGTLEEAPAPGSAAPNAGLEAAPATDVSGR